MSRRSEHTDKLIEDISKAKKGDIFALEIVNNRNNLLRLYYAGLTTTISCEGETDGTGYHRVMELLGDKISNTDNTDLNKILVRIGVSKIMFAGARSVFSCIVVLIK